MNEQPPQELTKFKNTRDQALYLMAQEGWGNESNGNKLHELGWFARVSNDVDDAELLGEVFDESFQSVGVTVADIMGHWLVVEDELGFVEVTEFPNATKLYITYHERELEWLRSLEAQG